MPRTIAVIPVNSRHAILPHTIRRLYDRNGVWKVICVGDSEQDKALCEDMGAFWIHCENYPLSKKWNRGMFAASMYEPDYYMTIGSSDWISDNWLHEAYKAIKGHHMTARKDLYLLDNGREGHKRLAYWSGHEGQRKDEPSWVGRLLSAELMERLNYAPFDTSLNTTLDHNMHMRIQYVGGKVAHLNSDTVSLTISDSRYPKKHNFEDHWNGRIESELIEYGISDWCRTWFPEALEIK